MVFKFLGFLALFAVVKAGDLLQYSAAPIGGLSSHVSYVTPSVSSYSVPVAKYAAPAISYAAPAISSYAAPIAKYASPAYVAQAPIISKTIVEEAPAAYDFEYNVNDPHTGDSKFQQESRHGDQVQGRYGLVEPDGTKRVVEYSADAHNGFNAVVHKEPLSHGEVAKIAAPVARYASAPAYGYASAPHYSYAAAPAVAKIATYASAPAYGYASAPHYSYAAAPAVAKIATYASAPAYGYAAPAVTKFAAPLASYAHAPSYSYAAAPVVTKFAAPAAYSALPSLGYSTKFIGGGGYSSYPYSTGYYHH